MMMLRRVADTGLQHKLVVPLDVELAALATAVPRHSYTQDEALALAARSFPELEHLRSVFANSGIETRYSCVPLEWFGEPHGWVDRNATYERCALELLERAARKAMTNARLGPRDIGAIIAVSTTGLSVPSLDAKLMHRLELNPETERLPIFGLGCAGGITGLAHATRLAAAMPGRNVLMACVELCGLNFRTAGQNKVDFVSCALFGDGAAAAILRGGGAGSSDALGQILAIGEHTWPGTEDVMGWSIEEDGFGVVMSTKIPLFARRELRAAAESFLAAHDMALNELDGIIAHPGGRKVLEAICDALNIDAEQLDHARTVLRDYGNMSSPTVLFVLERTIAAQASGRHLMAAFGPGFTVSFALLGLSPA